MRRLFILRPEPGSHTTIARARAIGLEAEPLTLVRIEPLEWEAPDASRFDAILLTSANAVRSAGGKLAGFRGLPAHAVGEATAEAAREARLAVASIGDKDVEALLRIIPTEQRLLHLCGEQRASVPATGHRITAVPVYRSALLPVDGVAERLRGQVAAVHSPRVGERLAELVSRADRATIRVAAISGAAAQAAGKGWERVESAPAPNDGALLALAARLCEEASRR